MYIDVRTKEEWDEGHMEGALHFDLERMMFGELPDLPKDTEIKLYCRSGSRAGMAKEILEKSGFTSVKNIGGFDSFK